MPYKRGRKWVAQVTKDGQKMARRFLTKNEALDWEVQKRKEIESGIIPVQDPDEDETDNLIIQEEKKSSLVQTMNTTCLGEWANSYLDYAQSVFSTKTSKEKGATFRSFFSSVDPTLPSDSWILMRFWRIF
jgi:tRNA G37 N-methylase Trm5